jgi:hypothetical protein
MRVINEHKRVKQTGKGAGRSFVALPHYMLDSEAWGALSPHAVKVIVEAARQFKGDNNGDFSLPWSRMRRRGWKSKSTLSAAIHEAIEAGFLERSRFGNRNHVCALYAITWKPIDECGGKLQIPPTKVASSAWRKSEKSSLCVPSQVAMCTTSPENEAKAA